MSFGKWKERVWRHRLPIRENDRVKRGGRNKGREIMKKRWVGVLLALALGQVVHQPWAASFDCGKASTKVDKLICADPALSRLDGELARAYGDKLSQASAPNTLKQAQRIWLKLRNTCIDPACIRWAYENRLQALAAANTPPTSASSPVPTTIADTTNGSVRPAKGGVTDDYLLDPAPKEMIDWNWEKYTVPEDKEVCDLYLNNLRYFARRNQPLSCGQPVAPMLKDKIKPAEWENLNPEKYPGLAKGIVKLADFMQTDPSTKEAVERVRYLRESRGFVFRLLKLVLNGSPVVEEGSNRPSPKQEYLIVQYGSDIGNPDNPDSVDRCHPMRGRMQASIGASYHRPRLFAVTQDLSHVFGELLDWRGSFINNLWIIKNRVYGESYDEKGNVKLTQLSLDYPVWFEAICLYHFKNAHRE